MYTKTNWVARVGTALNRFLKTNETSTEVELTNDPTGVTTAGTPFTVANMNKIEQGIYDAHVGLDNNGLIDNTRINQDVRTTASPTFASINTGHGTNELYAMNQNVRTTDQVTFATVNTGQGNNELYGMNQGVKTTDSPHFANMNPPVDNNDDTPPIIGIGGFTFAKSGPNSSPTVTLQSTGTFICIVMRFGDNGVRDCYVSRFEGGSVITGFAEATGGTLHVLIFRIA